MGDLSTAIVRRGLPEIDERAGESIGKLDASKPGSTRNASGTGCPEVVDGDMASSTETIMSVTDWSSGGAQTAGVVLLLLCLE